MRRVILLIILYFTFLSSKQLLSQQTFAIPVGGNAWIMGRAAGAEIKPAGLINWTKEEAVCKIYFRINKPQTIRVKVKLKVIEGESKLKFTLLGKEQLITLKESNIYDLGDFEFKSEGYYSVEASGVEKSGAFFGEWESVLLSFDGNEADLSYVKNNNNDFFYWGRRGPSSHLFYTVPNDTAVEWFYNEVTVPAGSDIIGSYFMVTGFSCGYFGMQVNSDTERRILFSVWSPNKAEDPKDIPEDEKVILNKKGEGVYNGEFGAEGAGAQSYLKYNWKTDITYKFLVHAKPAQNNFTDFTAYFYDNDKKAWKLIASFSRPKTSFYLKGIYSFLENFEPETGNIDRTVYFGNQWIKPATGNWMQLQKADYYYDETANIGYRRDHDGGVSNDLFFLRGVGFFNETKKIGIHLERKVSNKKFNVNLKLLPTK